MCTDWLKNRKVKLYGYCSLNSNRSLTNACPKKKEKKGKGQTPNPNSALVQNGLSLPANNLSPIES